MYFNSIEQAESSQQKNNYTIIQRYIEDSFTL